MVKNKGYSENVFRAGINDIAEEVYYYKRYFKNKIVYLNCDDENSSFWKYFIVHFERLGLKKLIATNFSDSKKVYKSELENGIITRTPLRTNGDFRNRESILLLEECDIVVAFPALNMVREHIVQTMVYKKDFLVMGGSATIITEDIFKYFKNELLFFGVGSPKKFIKEDGIIKKSGKISWLTNMLHNRKNQDHLLVKYYNETDYPTYDNYEAIDINRLIDIPVDYFGAMGVPSTYLKKHCREQFEILGQTSSWDKSPAVEELRIDPNKRGRGFINNKEKRIRIIIKRR